jgi:riboflavin synthase
MTCCSAQEQSERSKMFTGIITDKGNVRSVEKRGDTRFVINTAFDPNDFSIGASIACSGVCLTVVDKGTDADGGWFAVDASGETLSLTNLGGWAVGTKINLERSLRVGDELGGHIVSGHVDGMADIVSITPEGDSQRYTFKAPDRLAKFIAAKGSVTLNGVSLTVNEVEGNQFGVNLIPHTQTVTTFGDAAAGDDINLEIDVLARYVARLAEE